MRAQAVDLFAGLGTLTFALATEVGRVRAVRGRRRVGVRPAPCSQVPPAARRECRGARPGPAAADCRRSCRAAIWSFSTRRAPVPPSRPASSGCRRRAHGDLCLLLARELRPRRAHARRQRHAAGRGSPDRPVPLRRRGRAGGPAGPAGCRKTPLIPRHRRRYIAGLRSLSPSSSGPGRRPLTAKTGVRVP